MTEPRATVSASGLFGTAYTLRRAPVWCAQATWSAKHGLEVVAYPELTPTIEKSKRTSGRDAPHWGQYTSMPDRASPGFGFGTVLTATAGSTEAAAADDVGAPVSGGSCGSLAVAAKVAATATNSTTTLAPTATRGVATTATLRVSLCPAVSLRCFGGPLRRDGSG